MLAMMDQRNIKSAPETRVGQQGAAMAIPNSAKSASVADMQAASLNDLMMRRNMLMKSVYGDEMAAHPNPVDLANVASLDKNVSNMNRNVNNGNVFQSFMGQYWGDLPDTVSSSQVVDEIIATFHQREQQR